MELITRLFEHKPDDDSMLIWTLPDKRSYWLTYPGDIVNEFIIPLSARDIYFGLATVTSATAEACGMHKRTTAATAAGIGAFWLDIDVKSPAHKKDNLPETKADAQTLLLDFLPFPPSVVVDSGHGLQAYYILDKWLAITDANRADVKNSLLQFNTVWRNHCKYRGFDADSVCDLARVMRLPGSTNWKIREDPAAVKVIEDNPDTYSVADIHAAIAGRLATVTPVRKQPDMVSESPEPTSPTCVSADRWEALCLVDNRVRESWNHARADLADQSPSAYDMSLAAFAIRAGWTKSEAYKLLVECRHMHGLPVKEHALKLTVEKAVTEAEDLGKREPVTDDRSAKIARISAGLGFEIKTLTRYDSDPPAYRLTLADGRHVSLGTIDGLTDQRKFRNLIAAAVSILPTKVKPDQWDGAVRLLLSIAEHDSAGIEATETGMTCELIAAYLRDTTVHSCPEDGLQAGQPWTQNGSVHITAVELRQWIHLHAGDKIPIRQLSLALRAIGAQPVVIDQAQGRRHVWRIPRDVWTPKEDTP